MMRSSTTLRMALPRAATQRLAHAQPRMSRNHGAGTHGGYANFCGALGSLAAPSQRPPHLAKALGAAGPKLASPTGSNAWLGRFIGRWDLCGGGGKGLLVGAWRNNRLELEQTGYANQGSVRMFDVWQQDSEAFVRREVRGGKQEVLFSGGWLGNTWVWKRYEPVRQITYTMLQPDFMVILCERPINGTMVVTDRIEAHKVG